MHLRKADRDECAALGMNPLYSLHAGMEAGRATAIIDGRYYHECIGAFGWTHSGSIWGLFTDLTRVQSMEILRQTPQWVRGMLRESGCKELGNIVHRDNKAAVSWLVASECFTFDWNNVVSQGSAWLPFKTREGLLNV